MIKKKLRCILLVDDNEFINVYAQKLLEFMEVSEHIQAVENGQEGIDYLTSQGKFVKNGKNYPQPDIIFLDINMPVMDGWEFLEQYKLLPIQQRGNILIVMLTTSPNPDDRQKASLIEIVSDYRRKPLNKEMMEEILNKHFKDHF